MGSACSTHGEGEQRMQDFGGKARMKQTTMKKQMQVG
jgi:hypothetical protein